MQCSKSELWSCSCNTLSRRCCIRHSKRQSEPTPSLTRPLLPRQHPTGHLEGRTGENVLPKVNFSRYQEASRNPLNAAPTTSCSAWQHPWVRSASGRNARRNHSSGGRSPRCYTDYLMLRCGSLLGRRFVEASCRPFSQCVQTFRQPSQLSVDESLQLFCKPKQRSF